MITRDEYIKALDVVESYHKQIIEESKRLSNVKKTSIKHWKETPMASSRLQHCLRIISQDQIYPHGVIYEGKEYIEDVEIFDILRCRNTGKKTWQEFVKLRGY